MLQLPLVWQTALLLTASNVFMTFDEYTERTTCRVSQFIGIYWIKSVGKC
jgi:uncharacterized protein (DUF486 family)